MTKERVALITKVLGERCPEHNDACMTCLAWQLLDAANRRRELLKGWILASDDFDMNAWIRQVRDEVEDSE